MPYSLETGEKISFQTSPSYNKFENYKVQLKETVDMTGNGDCVEYPNENHVSYSACIEAEMRAKILPGNLKVNETYLEIMYRNLFST